MIKLNKKVEYALIALLHLAKQEPGMLVNSREIADEYSIPSELLGKILQKLSRAAIISSVQGTNGGYQLNFPIHKLSLYDIIEHLEGPVQLTQCTSYEEETRNCRQLDSCTIKHIVGDIQLEINHFFKNITLDKFISEAIPVSH